MAEASLPALIEVPEPPPGADERALVIGRSIGCDFVLNDPTVSRWHAELSRGEDGWVVRDMGSTNGTRVNGWRIRKATIGPDDVVALGAQRLVLRPRG